MARPDSFLNHKAHLMESFNLHRREHQPAPRRALNLKAIVICSVVFVAASMGFHRLHSRQVVATAQHLRQQADVALANDNPQESIRALQLYLAFRGGDLKARRTLSKLIGENAPDKDSLLVAYSMNEELLLSGETDQELRLRQAWMAVRLDRLADAESHLKTLRRIDARNPEVWHLSGLTAERLGQEDQAESWLRRAIELQSSDAESWAALIRLLEKRRTDPSEVDRLFRELTARHASAESWTVYAAWLQQQDRHDDAEAAIWSGLRLQSDHHLLNSLLLSIIPSTKDKTATQKQQRIVKHLEEQVRDNPDASRLRLTAAHAQWRAGLQTEAAQTLRSGIARDPQSWDLQEALADYLGQLRQPRAAREVFDRIPSHVLADGHWLFLQGRLHMAEGQWNRAASCFKRAHGFAQGDQQLQQRARMCQAICSRELGDSDDAVEAYRSILQSNPAAREGRLGMAAAWLESNRRDLAITEYRELLDVPGVPELLASLLIKETLQLPVSRRNWREVESLISDDSTLITDPVQKTLLQADLLFAQSFPAQALRLLDQAAERYPHSVPLQSARRRVLSDRQRALYRRMQESVDRAPHHLEAYVTIVRLLCRRSGATEAIQWLARLRRQETAMSQVSRLVLSAGVAETAALDIQRLGEPEHVERLLADAQASWLQAADLGADQWPQAAAFLARHRSASAVLAALNNMPPTVKPSLAAMTWIAALQQSPAKQTLQLPVEAALRQLVQRHPSDMGLRLAYGNYLIQFDGLPQALTLCRQIVNHEPHNAEALSQCAWILAMTSGVSDEAMEFSENASRYAPQSVSVRTVRAFVLARSKSPQDAVSVFQSIPAESRTPQSWLYEAEALWRSGDQKAATALVDVVEQTFTPARWCPADQDLLRELSGRQSTSAAGDRRG